jgi:hypothetical protein
VLLGALDEHQTLAFMELYSSHRQAAETEAEIGAARQNERPPPAGEEKPTRERKQDHEHN